MRGALTSVKAGDAVQTPFGKGIVREIRNNNQLLVDVQGRALVVSDGDVAPLDGGRQHSRRARPAERPPESRTSRPAPVEIDLHGMTVDEALARVERALNDALLADAEGLRIIHGRSGGRIRAALHRRLRELPIVRGFRLDPRNEGVTIVQL